MRCPHEGGGTHRVSAPAARGRCQSNAVHDNNVDAWGLRGLLRCLQLNMTLVPVLALLLIVRTTQVGGGAQ